MFRRNETKTRSELLRAELGESWGHAVRAAGHAAGGVRAAVGPKVAPAAGRVRGAASSGWGSTRSALAPIGETAQDKVRIGRRGKATRARWPRAAGLLVGGVAAGAVTAFMLRRRRQREQWDDYQQTEPSSAGILGEDRGGAASGAASGPAGAGEGPGSAAMPATPPERPEPASGRSGAGAPPAPGTVSAPGGRNARTAESVDANRSKSGPA